MIFGITPGEEEETVETVLPFFLGEVTGLKPV